MHLLMNFLTVKGKNFLLFFIFSMLVQGPMTNTLENFDRAADSVVCGAELAMNQTQQLMERAATPLLCESSCSIKSHNTAVITLIIHVVSNSSH